MSRATSVHWSDEDQEFVATDAAWPSLSFLASTPEGATTGLNALINDILADPDYQQTVAAQLRCGHMHATGITCRRLLGHTDTIGDYGQLWHATPRDPADPDGAWLRWHHSDY